MVKRKEVRMQNDTRRKNAQKTWGEVGNPLDFLFMPTTVHRHISRRAIGLVGAFLLVGFFDAILLKNLLREGIFAGPAGLVAVRVALIAILAVLIGTIDVICVMWPVADFARFLARREERFISGGIHVILMKSYSLSHLFFILPTTLLVYNPVDWSSAPAAWSTGVKIEFALLAAILQLVPLVQLGIVFRTLGVRSKLELFSRLMVVALMYLWMQIAGEMVIRLTLLGLEWILAIV